MLPDFMQEYFSRNVAAKSIDGRTRNRGNELQSASTPSLLIAPPAATLLTATQLQQSSAIQKRADLHQVIQNNLRRRHDFSQGEGVGGLSALASEIENSSERGQRRKRAMLIQQCANPQGSSMSIEQMEYSVMGSGGEQIVKEEDAEIQGDGERIGMVDVLYQDSQPSQQVSMVNNQHNMHQSVSHNFSPPMGVLQEGSSSDKSSKLFTSSEGTQQTSLDKPFSNQCNLKTQVSKRFAQIEKQVRAKQLVKDCSKCSICKRVKENEMAFQNVIQRQLMNSVRQSYSIKENFYYVRGINDILFNNKLLQDDRYGNYNDGCEDEGAAGSGSGETGVRQMIKSKNYQQLTGKLLTAQFKDFLIYDDIFEFLQTLWKREESHNYIVKYARYQRQVAVIKYGFKKQPLINGNSWQHHYQTNENVVNRPNYVRIYREIQKYMNRNIKLKYYTRYEIRLAEQRMKVKQKQREMRMREKMKFFGKKAIASLDKDDNKLTFISDDSDRLLFQSIIDQSQIREYSSFVIKQETPARQGAKKQQQDEDRDLFSILRATDQISYSDRKQQNVTQSRNISLFQEFKQSNLSRLGGNSSARALEEKSIFIEGASFQNLFPTILDTLADERTETYQPADSTTDQPFTLKMPNQTNTATVTVDSYSNQQPLSSTEEQQDSHIADSTVDEQKIKKNQQQNQPVLQLCSKQVIPKVPSKKIKNIQPLNRNAILEMIQKQQERKRVAPLSGDILPDSATTSQPNLQNFKEEKIVKLRLQRRVGSQGSGVMQGGMKQSKFDGKNIIAQSAAPAASYLRSQQVNSDLQIQQNIVSISANNSQFAPKLRSKSSVENYYKELSTAANMQIAVTNAYNSNLGRTQSRSSVLKTIYEPQTTAKRDRQAYQISNSNQRQLSNVSPQVVKKIIAFKRGNQGGSVSGTSSLESLKSQNGLSHKKNTRSSTGLGQPGSYALTGQQSRNSRLLSEPRTFTITDGSLSESESAAGQQAVNRAYTKIKINQNKLNQKLVQSRASSSTNSKQSQRPGSNLIEFASVKNDANGHVSRNMIPKGQTSKVNTLKSKEMTMTPSQLLKLQHQHTQSTENQKQQVNLIKMRLNSNYSSQFSQPKHKLTQSKTIFNVDNKAGCRVSMVQVQEKGVGVVSHGSLQHQRKHTTGEQQLAQKTKSGPLDIPKADRRKQQQQQQMLQVNEKLGSSHGSKRTSSTEQFFGSTTSYIKQQPQKYVQGSVLGTESQYTQSTQQVLPQPSALKKKRVAPLAKMAPGQRAASFKNLKASKEQIGGAPTHQFVKGSQNKYQLKNVPLLAGSSSAGHLGSTLPASKLRQSSPLAVPPLNTGSPPRPNPRESSQIYSQKTFATCEKSKLKSKGGVESIAQNQHPPLLLPHILQTSSASSSCERDQGRRIQDSSKEEDEAASEDSEAANGAYFQY